MKNDSYEKGHVALSAGDWANAGRLFKEALKVEESAEIYEQLAWA